MLMAPPMRLWQLGILMSIAGLVSLLLICNLALQLENERMDAALARTRHEAKRVGASDRAVKAIVPVALKSSTEISPPDRKAARRTRLDAGR